MAEKELCLLAKADIYNFYNTEFIERMQQNLSDLKNTVELLHQWDIPFELFKHGMIYSEKQVIDAAKELINAVCSCIDEKCTAIYQKSFEDMIDSTPKEEKESYMSRLMEKYLKAASMYQNKINVEKENFLIYVFDIPREDIPDRLNKMENHTQHLVESRNAFIQAAISWSRKKPDIKAAENQEVSDADSQELVFIEYTASIEEKEEDGNNRNENPDIASEIIETVDDGNSALDSYNAFYQIMDGKLECLENVSEKLEEKLIPVVSNGEAGISEESTRGEEKEQGISQEPFKIDNDETAVKQELQSTSTKEEKIKKKQEAVGKKESDKKSEESKLSVIKENVQTYAAEEWDDFQKECSIVLQKWIHMLQNGEKPELSDVSQTNRMCWKLLQKGEFILARETAAAFRESSSGNCVNPTVIDVLGSGLYMPTTEEDTQQYFLSCQLLLQFDQLDSFEQMAVALATLPIAHCCYEVRLDKVMLDVLPETFRRWAYELERLRTEITYIDRTAVESYRVYQVRMKKIDQIQKKAKQQFEAMLNSKIQYEGANKILTAVCSKDQCVGVLWDLMNETDVEHLAVGTINQKVEELYQKGRIYISEKKNTLKAVSEELVSRVVEDGRKKCGYKTEIVGTSKNKMMQMVREFLMTANEWLELIGSPCSYNRNVPSSEFIQKLSQSYQKYRSRLYEDAKGMVSGTYLLPDIIQNTLASMDYLMGIQEKMPQVCKSYLEHIYRLCSKPNLYIKKDRSDIYRCECRDQIEHLQFLNEVICSRPSATDACLKKFIEADAFSGCSVIFEMAERFQPERFTKIKESYERSVQKRIDELRHESTQMKKDLYQLSVYAGWFGNDYLSLTSKITMIEQMMKDEPRDLTMLCTFVKECQSGVNSLVEKFRGILRKQVAGKFNEEQSNKLYTLIEEGQYAAVIEWISHINISDSGVEDSDFFKERYFNEDIYSRKEKSLLQRIKIKDLVERLQTAMARTNSWEGFDFNRVPGRIGNLRGQLIQMWYQIKSELMGITRSNVEKNMTIFYELEQMLKMLGWDVIELKECSFCEDESGGYLQFDMYFRPTHSRERCPIPLFGSGSDGRIRMICLYGNTNAPDKQYDLFENKNQQIPMIILFFGVMTHMRRRELQSMSLDKQSSFLLVDDIVITTICERRESMILRWLYVLTVPFSVQKLYTAALGVVHPEMFYGRVSAKAELGLNGTVCAVYGGRQLGKTALLKNIESETHDPKVDHFVYYISLPTVMVENPDAVLTKEIVNALWDDIPIDRKCENMEGVLENISAWLWQKETRRLLLLLDEADEFLLADGKNGFRVTSNVNRIMTNSNLRFKVVFAGLHNVYRSISSPNNPLAHYGKPISIGPLLDDELLDAVNLIRQPFSLMGYRFESLDLIVWILAETNYYPSLIQLFCMKLQDYLHRPEVRKQRKNTLPVIICRKDIDSVLKDQTLKKSICERFMWTLDLDDRYKAIVLSIAFDAGHTVQTDLFNDFAKGYDLQWIHSEIEKWPNLFKGHSSLDELRGLCDELIQLGILRSVSSDRYTLRSANILYMLGTQESILRKMYELESRRYDYDKMYNGTLYRSIFHKGEFSCKCYPLTNQQLHSALDTGGLKLIAGSHALGINDVEQCLRELLAIDMENPSKYDLYQQKAYKLYVHDARLPNINDLGDCLSIHLIHWECPWKTEELQCYKQNLDSLEEQDRPVLLLLCDEKRSRKLQNDFLIDAFNIPVIRLAAWDLEAVQFWLNELSAPPLLMEDLIRITERLCGWPIAMYQLWKLMVKNRQEFDFDSALLDQTVAYLDEYAMLSDFLPKEDLEPLLHPILNIYAEYEADMSCEDIEYILEEEDSQYSMEYIENTMAWMADLGLLNRQIQEKDINGDEKMKYSIDSLILELWKKQSASV